MRGTWADIAAVALGVVGAVSSVARGSAGDVVLLDRALVARSAMLVGYSDKGVVVRPAAGAEPETVALDSLAAIVPAAWWTPEDDAASAGRGVDAGRSAAERGGWGILEFADGQRTVGRLLTGAGEAPNDAVRWESNLLGQLVVPLEKLARIRMEGFGGAAEAAAARAVKSPGGAAVPAGAGAGGAGGAAGVGGAGDFVLLSNGDTLRGFVEAVGGEVRVKVGGADTSIEVGKVREIRLAQPAVPPTGTFVWLADGTVVRAQRLGAEPGGRSASLVRMIVSADEGRAQRVGLNATQIRAVAPRAEGVTALSSLEVRRQELAAGRLGGGALRAIMAADPLLGALDVELPGPMGVDWALPGGVRAVAGWAVLPETAREWGMCTLALGVIDEAGGLVGGARVELSGGSPAGAFRIEVPAGAKAATLRANLVAGPYGPVQCRVVLRRVVLSRG